MLSVRYSGVLLLALLAWLEESRREMTRDNGLDEALRSVGPVRLDTLAGAHRSLSGVMDHARRSFSAAGTFLCCLSGPAPPRCLAIPARAPRSPAPAPRRPHTIAATWS